MNQGVFLTTGNSSHYGNTVAVQVKACKSYPEATLCSPNWSAIVPARRAREQLDARRPAVRRDR